MLVMAMAGPRQTARASILDRFEDRVEVHLVAEVHELLA
jgi:hypothetical protein